LLHGLMLVSGNDAANVLAENLAGSVPDFVSSLNDYLKDLGCKSTHFCNPHGLTHPEHMTTAYDLAIITKKALEFPYFRKIVSTLEFTKPKSNKQPPLDLKLTNPLLKPNSQYFYPKAIGVKTGYTAAAQNTLIAAAEHEGRLLIAVLLGYEKSSDRFLEARKLFETAFNEPTEKRRVLGPENIFTKEIQGSKKPLKASLMKSLVIEYFPSEESPCKAALHWTVSKLPIRKGQKVATVEIIDDRGQHLEKADLFALEEMKGSFLYTVYDKFCSLFGL
jgi:D-alanyl-D-alanine carboxypeptidase (penicillin-binding protein 5/6)